MSGWHLPAGLLDNCDYQEPLRRPAGYFAQPHRIRTGFGSSIDPAFGYRPRREVSRVDNYGQLDQDFCRQFNMFLWGGSPAHGNMLYGKGSRYWQDRW